MWARSGRAPTPSARASTRRRARRPGARWRHRGGAGGRRRPPSTRPAVGKRPLRPCAHEQAGDRLYRPLRGGEPDPHGPAGRRERFLLFGRSLPGVARSLHGAGRPVPGGAWRGGDEMIEPFETEGEVRPSLVPGESVDLVDDDRPHRADHLPSAGRGEEEVEGLRRRHDDLRPVAHHGRTLRRRRVAVSDRDLHLGRIEPELARARRRSRPRACGGSHSRRL